MAARAVMVNPGSFVDPGQSLRQGFNDLGKALGEVSDRSGKIGERRDAIFDEQIKNQIGEDTRDVIANTKNNRGDLLNDRATSQINDEYNLLNDRYAEELSTIEQEAVKAGFGETKYDAQGNLVASQKAIDAGNVRDDLLEETNFKIGELNAAQEVAVGKLNRTTLGIQSNLENAPVQNAEEHSQRVFRDLLQRGVPIEQAEATRKSVLAGNTEKDLTNRETLIAQNRLDTIDSDLLASQKLANTKLGTNKLAVTKGDKSTSGVGSGNSGSYVSTKKEANISSVIKDLEGTLENVMINAGLEKKDVRPVLSKAAGTPLRVNGKDYYASKTMIANAANESIENGWVPFLKGKQINTEKFRDTLANKIREAVASGNLGGSGKGINKTVSTQSQDIFAPNRAEFLKGAKQSANLNRAAVRDSLTSPRQKEFEKIQSEQTLDAAFGSRERIPKSKAFLANQALEDEAPAPTKSKATEPRIVAPVPKDPEPKDVEEKKVEVIKSKEFKALETEVQDKLKEVKTEKEFKKTLDTALSTTRKEVKDSIKEFNDFAKNLNRETATVSELKEFDRLEEKKNKAATEFSKIKNLEISESVKGFFKNLFKSDIDKAAEREAESFNAKRDILKRRETVRELSEKQSPGINEIEYIDGRITLKEYKKREKLLNK